MADSSGFPLLTAGERDEVALLRRGNARCKVEVKFLKSGHRLA